MSKTADALPDNADQDTFSTVPIPLRERRRDWVFRRNVRDLCVDIVSDRPRHPAGSSGPKLAVVHVTLRLPLRDRFTDFGRPAPLRRSGPNGLGLSVTAGRWSIGPKTVPSQRPPVGGK